MASMVVFASCLHMLPCIYTSGCSFATCACVWVCMCVSGHGCGLYFQGPPAPPRWWLTAAISFLSEWVYNPCSDHTLCLHLVGVSRTRAESRHNSSVPAVYLISLYYNKRQSGRCSPPDRFYDTISEKYDSGYSWNHNLFFLCCELSCNKKVTGNLFGADKQILLWWFPWWRSNIPHHVQ